ACAGRGRAAVEPGPPHAGGARVVRPAPGGRRRPVSRVGVVGSRHFPDLERVASYVRGLPPGDSVVTGGASGVDATVARAARERGLPVLVVGASFEEARDAGVAATRNQRLIDLCDVLVAFWDGAS